MFASAFADAVVDGDDPSNSSSNRNGDDKDDEDVVDDEEVGGAVLGNGSDPTAVELGAVPGSKNGKDGNNSGGTATSAVAAAVDVERGQTPPTSTTDAVVVSNFCCGYCNWICCLGEATCCTVISVLGCASFTAGLVLLILFLARGLVNKVTN